ncbi:MAG TPA: alpha/beta hydrolase [Actinobacteria bacterium]|nr:alpha/beta hydrolase [Actinomycetota bacterium]
MRALLARAFPAMRSTRAPAIPNWANSSLAASKMRARVASAFLFIRRRLPGRLTNEPVSSIVPVSATSAWNAMAHEHNVDFYSWGTRCSAVIRLPGGTPPTAGWPAIVMAHGFRGIKEWLLPPTAQALADAGFAVLTFDYRGFGTTDGERGLLVPERQVEDIRNALTFLSAVEVVDPERLGLWGTSFGCGTVIEATARDSRVKAVVGQIGFGSAPRMLERFPPERRTAFVKMLAEDAVRRVRTGDGATIDPAVLLNSPESDTVFADAEKRWPHIAVQIPLNAVERIFEYEPERFVAAVAPRPLLLIGATHDHTVPHSEIVHLYRQAREPKELLTIDVGHYEVYSGPGADKARARTVGWFRSYL